MNVSFEDLRRHVTKWVKVNSFSIAVDEEQRYHELMEIAGDCLGEFFHGADSPYPLTTFFLLCDELGLDESFKQLDLDLLTIEITEGE